MTQHWHWLTWDKTKKGVGYAKGDYWYFASTSEWLQEYHGEGMITGWVNRDAVTVGYPVDVTCKQEHVCGFPKETLASNRVRSLQKDLLIVNGETIVDTVTHRRNMWEHTSSLERISDYYPLLISGSSARVDMRWLISVIEDGQPADVDGFGETLAAASNMFLGVWGFRNSVLRQELALPGNFEVVIRNRNHDVGAGEQTPKWSAQVSAVAENGKQVELAFEAKALTFLLMDIENGIRAMEWELKQP